MPTEPSPEDMTGRFNQIARALGASIFPALEDLAPALQIVIGAEEPRTLGDLDRAMLEAEHSLGAGVLLDESETDALRNFRRGVKAEHGLWTNVDAMSLRRSLRDGRLSIEALGEFAHKISIYRPPSEPTDEASAPRQAPQRSARPKSHINVRKDRAQITNEVATADECQELEPRLRLNNSSAWAPSELAAVCVKHRGVRIELRTDRGAAKYLEGRLSRMGLNVTLEPTGSSTKREAAVLLIAWLDFDAGAGRAYDY